MNPHNYNAVKTEIARTGYKDAPHYTAAYIYRKEARTYWPWPIYL